MLIYKLLFTIAVEYSDIIIEASYKSLKLKAVCEDYCNSYFSFAALIEENVLADA